MIARRYALAPLLAACLLATNLTAAHAAGTFFGPSPYLSAADVPAGFYQGGAPTLLDNLEDGSLDASLTATNSFGGPNGTVLRGGDSVDADDGNINGVGGALSLFAAGVLTFTYVGSGPLPTAFGLVWTDGVDTITFSAKDASGQSLGSWSFSGIPGGTSSSDTAEDRFFGVQFAGGIKSISIANGFNGGTANLEVDHIQYGQMAAVPEPESYAMALVGVGLVGMMRFKAARKPSA